MSRILSLLLEMIAGISDLTARAGTQVDVNLQEFIRSSRSFFGGN